MTPSFTIQLVEILKLTELREVSAVEVRSAAKIWAIRPGFDRNSQRRASPENFVRAAKKWLTFHNVLSSAAPSAFSKELTEYQTSMLTFHGLAEATVRGYSGKIAKFLRWGAKNHKTLDSISLNDIPGLSKSGSLRTTRWLSSRLNAKLYAHFFHTPNFVNGVSQESPAVSKVLADLDI